jgi:2-polyprenyl-6-hydroxyphenyl methylase/3-demethylubiquinone-9 3-methyltransferase
MMAEQERFGFGKNWTDYIQKNLSDERVEISRKHMLDFLGISDLSGKTFLDIGCGSGLHSFAALKSNAARVVGFDYDVNSVGASRYVHRHAGSPANWQISQGSVLEETFVRSLGQYDIVYSWGVLHHTGDVWTAIRNASIPVAPGGLFYIALYSADVQKEPYTPEFWLDVKQRYLRSSWFGKRRWEWWYISTFMLGKDIRKLPEFFKRRADYRKNRGMDIMTDIRDWLGGWPMEFCWDEDVKKFGADKLGLSLVNIATGHANTEFLFRRAA